MPTSENYIDWLDREIEDNKKQIDKYESENLLMPLEYHEGCLSALCTAKEKFLSLYPSQESKNENT